MKMKMKSLFQSSPIPPPARHTSGNRTNERIVKGWKTSWKFPKGVVIKNVIISCCCWNIVRMKPFTSQDKPFSLSLSHVLPAYTYIYVTNNIHDLIFQFLFEKTIEFLSIFPCISVRRERIRSDIENFSISTWKLFRCYSIARSATYPCGNSTRTMRPSHNFSLNWMKGAPVYSQPTPVGFSSIVVIKSF